MKKLLLTILTCAAVVLFSSCQPEQETGADQGVISEQEQTPQPDETLLPEVPVAGDTEKTVGTASDTEETTVQTVPPEEADDTSISTEPGDADESSTDTVTTEVTDTGENDSGKSDEPVSSSEKTPVKPPKAEPVETTPAETEKPDTKPESKTDAKPDSADDAEPGPEPEASIFKEYDSILKTYVDKEGDVNYRTLRRKRGDLFDIAGRLAGLKPNRLISFDTDEEEIAFWINAHNMLTLKLIVENYPIKRLIWRTPFYPFDSIKHINGGREKTYFVIATYQHTLQEIEQAMLNKFNDPRLCFAFSYASASSPPLRNEIYTAKKLDKQLNDQIRKFLKKETSIKIDRNANVVYLSSVFTLYEKTFIKSEYAKIKRLREKPENLRSFLNFAIEYVPRKDAEYLRTAQYDVKFMVYDWHLNEQTLK